MKPAVNAMTIADAARAYVAEGWPVVLLHRPIAGPSGTTICSCGVDPAATGRDHKVGKHPITAIHPHGSKDAIADLPTLEAALGRLAAEALPANLAVILPDGVACIDLDPPRGDRSVHGSESLGSWMADHPGPGWGEMRSAPAERTGSGGIHMLVADLGISQRVGSIPGVDYLRAGSMLVVAPSLHPTGETNAWVTLPTLGGSFPPVAAPLAEFLRPLGGYAQLPPGSVGVSVSFDAVAAATQLGGRWPTRTAAWGASAAKGAEDTLSQAIAGGPGTRNNELFRQACAVFQLAQLGVLDADSATERLARLVLDDGMGSDEVASTLRSAKMRADGSLREVRKGFLADLIEAAEAAGIAVPLVAGATEHATTKEITPARYDQARIAIATQVTARLGPLVDLDAVRADVARIVDSALQGPSRELALGICEHAANEHHAAIPQNPSHFLSQDVAETIVDRRNRDAAEAEAIRARQAAAAPLAPPRGVSPEAAKAFAEIQARTARGESVTGAEIDALEVLLTGSLRAPRPVTPYFESPPSLVDNVPTPTATAGGTGSSPTPPLDLFTEPVPTVIAPAAPEPAVALTRSELAEMVTGLGRAAAVLSPTWAGREDAAEAIVAALDEAAPEVTTALLSVLDLPDAIDAELVLIDSIARAGGVPTSVDRNERAEAKAPDHRAASSLVLGALAKVDVSVDVHLPEHPEVGRLSTMSPLVWPTKAERDPGVVVDAATAPTFARFGTDAEKVAALDVLEAARARSSPGIGAKAGVDREDAEGRTRVLWAEALANWHPYGGKAADHWAWKATARDLVREVKGVHTIDRTAAHLDAPTRPNGSAEGTESLATLADRVASMAPDPADIAVAHGTRAMDLDWLKGALPAKDADILGRQIGCFGHDPQSPTEIAEAMGMSVQEVQAAARNALRVVTNQFGEDLGRRFATERDPVVLVADTAETLEMSPTTVARHLASVIMRSENGARRLAPEIKGAGGIDAWATRVGNQAQAHMEGTAPTPAQEEQTQRTTLKSQSVPQPVPGYQPAPAPAPVFETVDLDPEPRLVPALSMRVGR